MSQAELNRAITLLEKGALDDALLISMRLAAEPRADHLTLATHSQVLKLLHRLPEALAVDQIAAGRFPKSGVAWHNLAATLDDMGRGEAALEAMNRGVALGLDGPESWGVMARILMTLGDHEKAEQAYVEARRRAPADVRLTTEYANLVWMRRGDLNLAQAAMDTAFHAGAAPGEPLIAKAQLYETAGQGEMATDLLLKAAEKLPRDIPVVLAAAQSALTRGRLAEAEALARSAEVLAPKAANILTQMAIIHLAKGQPDLALEKALQGLKEAPTDQSLLGWAATAARAVQDPLYATLCDYDHMVSTHDIETPANWPSLEAYLADLAETLRRLHTYQQHPYNQSVRGGAQTLQNLTGSSDPVLQAFFKAIDAPVRAHMARLGKGPDAHRRRNTGDYRIQGAWSVRLRPGGFHQDHFHPEGWISSAFYVETPTTALDHPDRQGWLRFGQPPFRTDPPLAPDHHVRPQPGRLALFPSYMWHGTVPFHTDEPRMSIAFDIVPI